MAALHRWLIVVMAFAGFVFASGCDSGGRSTVKGQSTFEGAIVDDGGIAFLPMAGESSNRATEQIENGQYSLDSAREPNTGKYRVEVTWRKKTGKKVTREGGVLWDERVQVLPAKYNDATELIVDVKPGRNTFDFHLKK